METILITLNNFSNNFNLISINAKLRGGALGLGLSQDNFHPQDQLVIF